MTKNVFRFLFVLIGALSIFSPHVLPTSFGFQETETPEASGERAREKSNESSEAKPEQDSAAEPKAAEPKAAEPVQRRPRTGGQGGQRRVGAREPRGSEAARSDQSTDAAKNEPTLPQDWADKTPWRSIGPANMGGRIVALAVSSKDHNTWWAATASGGLLKTVNNGITFEFQFDKEATVSIGDVQVAPSNPDIVWIGTGEQNPRNSSSWGDGVYKSVDGGKTWTNMGLKESFQIGRMAIHPENPDIVWVGALGRLWGPNKERGLFKTIDGGKTWKKVLYVNEDTGVIDVKLNPKDPNELLVATFERRRGLFDVNDPIVRHGAGSGLYKSTDGGDSFKRLSNGLPNCKMGRIGLDYHAADPKTIVAVIDSEKIGKTPEKWAFLGVRGENADIGAKVTTVTADSPAAKAGLKTGDIIALVDGELATDYQAVLGQIRKREAGQKVKLVISRERKKMDLEVELAPMPEGQTGNNPFVGELGGQAPNLQEQQGSKGTEHGGLYQSNDSGESWTRINSINPRPMYFAHVRIDPIDAKNIYVCGVNLYRSSDGGKTFTGDGGDGTHADHHAIWINPSNPKHMLLGNDGGIYQTYDRMDNWDHLNHVAIGQFYHAGVDARLDYNVYGGLQDNGSWGGPSRGKHGQGPINSDWFRVGGGDGFVTLVDPEDPDQIYYESQNGGMGRTHLKTGERGFIAPRERGQRFRFNWKTPFILSPHNSKTHYSAGNFVFKSTQKGNNIKRISPEITNTSEGSGTAISESPIEEGVIYVGTNDGAVWMTKDGGKDWEPLFFTPETKKKEAEKPETGKVSESDKTDPKSETKSDAAPVKEGETKEPAKAETGEVKPATNPTETPAETKPAETKPDDPVSGEWTGRIEQEGVTEGPFEFSIDVKKDDQNKVTGTVESPVGALPVSSGAWDPDKRILELNIQSDDVSFTITGKIENNEMKGKTEIANTEMVIEFVATRKKKEVESKPESKPEPKAETKPESSKQDEPAAEKKDEPKAAEKETKAGEDSAKPADDPVSGRWVGTLSTPQGDREATFVMRKSANNQVTGTYETTRGERELTGKFDPKTNLLTLMIDGGRFEMNFSGKVEKDRYNGNIDTGSEEFSMSYDLKRESTLAGLKEEPRTAGAEVEVAKDEKPRPAGPTGEKSLAKLMPGPRFVSSIEASRFKAGRCYITFDGHRSNDDGVHLFVTNDYGKTWESLKANLPATAGSVHVLREDVKNENMLYLGCEFSAWFSIDAGKSWTQIKGDFPTVAVHEFAVHPTAGEVVAATHGRSLWIADVNNLRQFSESSIKADFALYQPKDVILWKTLPSRGDHGPRQFAGQNPSRNAKIAYSLGKNAGYVSCVIKDVKGDTIKTLEAPTTKGLHVLDWQLDIDRRGRTAGGPGSGGPQFGGSRLAPGDYLLVLEVDGKRDAKTISIKREPE